MDKHYFITGLPRSRTAWLANLLTIGDSFCLHAGLLRNGANLKRLAEHLDYLAKRYPCAGDSDPSLLPAPAFETMAKLFPGASWVFIERDPEDACAAHNTAFPELSMPLDVFQELMARMRALAPTVNSLWVKFDDLREARFCAALYRHCTGMAMDYERWSQLDRMRIVAHREVWLSRMDPVTREKVEAL